MKEMGMPSVDEPKVTGSMMGPLLDYCGYLEKPCLLCVRHYENHSPECERCGRLNRGG